MSDAKKVMTMQITVRLYRQHDMDLVGLYRTKDFKFQRHLKNALKAYAEGKDYRIDHPGDEDIRKGYVPKIVQLHIYLNPSLDNNAISVLQTIREGYRGAFLKALFRKYLNNEPLAAYKDRKDLIFNAEEDYLEYPEKNKTDGKDKAKDGEKWDRSKNNQERKDGKNENKLSEKSLPRAGEKTQNQSGNNHNNRTNRTEGRSEDYITHRQKETDSQKTNGYQRRIQNNQTSERKKDVALGRKSNERSGQNRMQQNRNNTQNGSELARNNHQTDHPANKENNFPQENEKTKTYAGKEDIIKEVNTKPNYNAASTTSNKQKDPHSEKSSPEQEFSFFDYAGEISEDDSLAEKTTRKERPSEADSDIPFSFFDNPDDDASEFLAQMNNLAH